MKTTDIVDNQYKREDLPKIGSGDEVKVHVRGGEPLCPIHRLARRAVAIAYRARKRRHHGADRRVVEGMAAKPAFG